MAAGAGAGDGAREGAGEEDLRSLRLSVAYSVIPPGFLDVAAATRTGRVAAMSPLQLLRVLWLLSVLLLWQLRAACKTCSSHAVSKSFSCRKPILLEIWFIVNYWKLGLLCF
eukprot:COSAG04_NODE_1248_length_7581_cov_24.589453_3_plen_112_part_00